MPGPPGIFLHGSLWFSHLCLSSSHIPVLKASDSKNPLWEGFWPWLWWHQDNSQVSLREILSHGPGLQRRKLPQDPKFLTLMGVVPNLKLQPAEQTAGLTLKQNPSWQQFEITTGAVTPWDSSVLKWCQISTEIFYQNSVAPGGARGSHSCRLPTMPEYSYWIIQEYGQDPLRSFWTVDGALQTIQDFSLHWCHGGAQVTLKSHLLHESSACPIEQQALELGSVQKSCTKCTQSGKEMCLSALSIWMFIHSFIGMDSQDFSLCKCPEIH